jgi:hypothetical protein
MEVDAFKSVVDVDQGLLGKCFVGRHGELTTQVEELMLNGGEKSSLVGRDGFAKQNANVGVEFIDIAQGDDAWVIFRKASVVSKSGGAIISGAGGNLSESVTHESS